MKLVETGVAQLISDIREFLAIYGASGTGKTRLACAAMRSDPERWGEKGIYVPFDGKRGLKSVLPADRERLVLAEFEASSEKGIDLYTEMVQLFQKDWSAILPGVRTIIVDPGTTFAKNLLAAIANAQVFTDKHIMISQRGEGKLAYPVMGDYGAAQNAVMNVLRFAEQCEYNVIWVFHETWKEPQSGSPELMIGGPDTVGSAIVSEVCGKFGNVIRTEAKSVADGQNKRLVYRAYTQDRGIWKAKLRVAGANPIPEVNLNEDPVNFWQAFNSAVK